MPPKHLSAQFRQIGTSQDGTTPLQIHALIARKRNSPTTQEVIKGGNA
jgi:hypothetical protein